jgi:hypothetical protein
MDQLSERLQTPISTAELERRWRAVRAAMERGKIDVLLMVKDGRFWSALCAKKSAFAPP